MKHTNTYLILFLLAAGLASPQPIFSQGETIPSSVVGSGGEKSSSSNFSLTGTLGQAAAGAELSSASFRHDAGFWSTVTVAPAGPTGLTAIPGDQQVNLLWNANKEPGLHKYTLYRGTESLAGTLIDSVVATSPPDTFYTDSGLTNGQIYYYRIRAVDMAGHEGGFSSEVSATPYGGPLWYVATDGSDTDNGSSETPFASIQTAIGSAGDGHTVLVSPGTYMENINFDGKTIVLQSTDGPDTTIIDGNQNGSVVTFDNEETSSSVLDGFTIQNGNAEFGGGISIGWNSSPTLSNLIITGNSADYGGGIDFDSSNATLTNVTITGNSAEYGGGGILCGYYSTPVLTDVTVSENTVTSGDGGGIALWDNSDPDLKRVVIHGNSSENGGGIFLDSAAVTLTNVTMNGNTAISSGSGVFSHGSDITVINSILWDDPPQGTSFDPDGPPSSMTISYSDYQDAILTNNNGTVNWGAGNIAADPLFVDAVSGNFNLTGDSPAIDAGDPDPQYNDPDGTIADMGAFHYDQSGQPARVKNLITTPGVNNISLKWDANSEADLVSYTVYRSTTTGANFSSVASVAIPDTEYVDSAVDPDVTYYYRVGAVDADSDESLLALEQHGRIAPDSTGLDLVSAGDYVTIPDLPPFVSTNDYTVELYAQPRFATTGDGSLIEGPNFSLELVGSTPGEFTARLTVGALVLDGTTSLTDSAWHHFAITSDGSNSNAALWVDGHLEAQGSATFEGSVDLVIGGQGDVFDVTIDEARVSNVLCYTGGFIPPQSEFAADANTLALWRFN